PLIGDFFIAASERYRLEAQEADGLGIIERKLDDAAYLLIVDSVHDGGNRNNLHSSVVQVVDGAQLYIKQIANLAMGIGGIADSVKLQVSIAEAGFGCLARELRRLGKLDSIGGCLHGVVTNLACIAHSVKEVRRERG